CPTSCCSAPGATEAYGSATGTRTMDRSSGTAERAVIIWATSAVASPAAVRRHKTRPGLGETNCNEVLGGKENGSLAGSLSEGHRQGDGRQVQLRQLDGDPQTLQDRH